MLVTALNILLGKFSIFIKKLAESKENPLTFFRTQIKLNIACKVLLEIEYFLAARSGYYLRLKAFVFGDTDIV